MHTPRNKTLLVAAALLLVVAVTSLRPSGARASAPRAASQAPAPQQAPAPSADPGVERGVQLYRQGDMKGAAKEFRAAAKRRKDDPLVWLYLGQALIVRGEMKDARKALETSLRLKPDFADARSTLAYLFTLSSKPREAEAEAKRALALDAAQVDARYVIGQIRLSEGAWLKALEEADAIIKVNDRAAAAYLLRAQAFVGLYERGNAVISDDRRGAYDFNPQTVEEARAAQPVRLREAAESLEKYARLSPNSPDAAELREQITALRFYSEAASTSDPSRKIYNSSELTERAAIQFKPEPGFTEEARRAGITGVVRLRAVLAADGQVRHILVLKRLSHGLTEKAIASARKIKFKPATVGGQPASQIIVLEYNFNIY